MEEVNNQELEELAIDSKYRKILIAAKRSKQLQRGAKPRVNLPNAKPTRIALEEVEQGLIDFEVIDQPQS
jgi:DNA-directed RNA polymerase subunit omega